MPEESQVAQSRTDVGDFQSPGVQVVPSLSLLDADRKLALGQRISCSSTYTPQMVVSVIANAKGSVTINTRVPIHISDAVYLSGAVTFHGQQPFQSSITKNIQA